MQVGCFRFSLILPKKYMLRTFNLLLVGVFAAICTFSCEKPIEFSKKQLSTQDSLFKEIMIIHDEVMPLTSTLVKRKDILEKSKNTDETTLLLIKQLETAEEAMWDWMYSIKRPDQFRDTLNHEQIMNYLNLELNSISEVKTLMINASNDSNQITEND